MYWTERHVGNRALMHKKCLQSHGQWACRWKSPRNVNKLTSCDNLANKSLRNWSLLDFGITTCWDGPSDSFFLRNKKVRAAESTVFCVDKSTQFFHSAADVQCHRTERRPKNWEIIRFDEAEHVSDKQSCATTLRNLTPQVNQQSNTKS